MQRNVHKLQLFAMRTNEQVAYLGSVLHLLLSILVCFPDVVT
uniref:Uncharacterized protein n=1 Tax=Arundo donax TaxID=35708 RepID=A0A0A9EFA6_ARUDO